MVQARIEELEDQIAATVFAIGAEVGLALALLIGIISMVFG
jgi:hypothetical protein